MIDHASGNRPTENVYLVDGLIVNDYANGSPRSGLNVNLGVDAVREFSVLTSEYIAQYGMTSGGVVNAIFKSGTNQFHGSAFEFLRNSALDARNFFDGAKVPSFRRNQFGASIGGPIRKDKTFFFANFEALRQFLSLSESSDTLSINARNGILTSGRVMIAPNIAPYLAAFPLPNGPVNGDSSKFNFAGAEKGNEYGTFRPMVSRRKIILGSLGVLAVKPAVSLTNAARIAWFWLRYPFYEKGLDVFVDPSQRITKITSPGRTR